MVEVVRLRFWFVLLSATLLIPLLIVALSALTGPGLAEEGRPVGGGDGLLEVSSTPNPLEVRRGETVTWNVTINNPTSKPVRGLFIKVVFDPEVEVLAASIPPSSAALFRLEEVGARSSATLSLVVRVPRSERIFSMSRSIRGEGFVSLSEEYSTVEEPYEIRCLVSAWAEGMDWQVRNTSALAVLGEEGQVVRVRETGSGNYSSSEEVRVDERNRSIEIERNVSADHRPFDLYHPVEGARNGTTLWSEMIELRNDLVEYTSYFDERNATHLQRWYHAILHQNGTVVSFGEGRRPPYLHDPERSLPS